MYYNTIYVGSRPSNQFGTWYLSWNSVVMASISGFWRKPSYRNVCPGCLVSSAESHTCSCETSCGWWLPSPPVCQDLCKFSLSLTESTAPPTLVLSIVAVYYISPWTCIRYSTLRKQIDLKSSNRELGFFYLHFQFHQCCLQRSMPDGKIVFR